MGQLSTATGSVVNRYRCLLSNTIFGMGNPRIYEVLARNVKSGMVAKYGQENQTKLVGESKIGPGTISRILGTEGQARRAMVRISTLEKVAKALGMEPWQLLFPGENKKDFLDLCQAWEQANDQGREMLRLATQAVLKRAEQTKPTGSASSR